MHEANTFAASGIAETATGIIENYVTIDHCIPNPLHSATPTHRFFNSASASASADSLMTLVTSLDDIRMEHALKKICDIMGKETETMTAK